MNSQNNIISLDKYNFYKNKFIIGNYYILTTEDKNLIAEYIRTLSVIELINLHTKYNKIISTRGKLNRWCNKEYYYILKRLDEQFDVKSTRKCILS